MTRPNLMLGADFSRGPNEWGKGRFALLTNAAVIAFAPGDPGWKLDADGKIELKDGNPVYIDASGREMTVEHGTIARLNGEARNHRERAEKAEAALKPFEGLDAEKARKAIETVGKIDAKTLIDAGEVDKVREVISKEYGTQLDEAKAGIADRDARINAMTIDTAFTRSKFASERVAVPLDMFQDRFSKHFKIEDGKPVPYDATGTKVFSKKRVGEVADFDEALEILVDQYPHKDSILKAPDAAGSGNGGGGGNRGGGRYIKRADFDKLPPHEQAATAASMAKGEVNVVD